MRKPSSIRLLLWLSAALLLTVGGMSDASTAPRPTLSGPSHHRSQVHAVTHNPQRGHRLGTWMMFPLGLMVAGYSMRRQQRTLNWHQPLTV
jgi:hypothetical protein